MFDGELTPGVLASGFKAYADPKRKVGSQSEVPNLSVEAGTIRVAGYQNYTVRNGRVDRRALSPKYRRLAAYLQAVGRVAGPEPTFLDIGCSAGLLSLLAKEAGFASVTGLDHDPEYIALVDRVSAASGLEVRGIVGGWRDARGQFDVVAAISLIHWIYSLTAAEGSFDGIFSHLAGITRRYLILEWVDHNDVAIRKLRHVFRNTAIHREKYSLENFLASADRRFGSIEATIETRSTRRAYVFRKEERTDGYAAMLRCSATSVRKMFKPRWVAAHPDGAAREVRALRALSAVSSGFPVLLDAGPAEITMTHVGERLTADNMPSDAARQGTRLVGTLRAKGIRHNAISPSHLLVRDGILSLVDFTSATFEDACHASLLERLGLRTRAKEPQRSIDDAEMMTAALQSFGGKPAVS